MLSERSGLIKLDIDKGMKRPTMAAITLKLARAGYRFNWLSETVSPGGNGFHITMELIPAPRNPEEVVAIQAMLGSDPYREASNLMRAKKYYRVNKFWRERWNVFYLRARKPK